MCHSYIKEDEKLFNSTRGSQDLEMHQRAVQMLLQIDISPLEIWKGHGRAWHLSLPVDGG